MTKTVEIDDDVYEYLWQNAKGFGETASSVLRRSLDLPEPTRPVGPAIQDRAGASPSAMPSSNFAPEGNAENSLSLFVNDPSFRLRNATDKVLLILSFAYRQNPAKFEKVLEISGRSRKYFGRSREEIDNSGTSTHPRPVPGSEYWVMTNADTRQKCDMLRKALKVLGYPAEDIRVADNVIF